MTTSVVVLQNGSSPARMRVRKRNAQGEWEHLDAVSIPYAPGQNTWAIFYVPDDGELVIDEPRGEN